MLLQRFFNPIHAFGHPFYHRGKPEQQAFNPNAETYTVELGHGPYTIRRADGEDDKTWAGRKKHLLNQRVGFLNSSGASGTPEQEAYLKEIYDRLAAHGR